MNAHTVQPDTVCGIKRNTEPSPGRESLVNKGESGNCSLMEAVKQKILLILRKRKHMGLYNKTGLLKCICQMRNLKIKGFEYSGKETSTSLLYQIHSDRSWLEVEKGSSLCSVLTLVVLLSAVVTGPISLC